jgi:competence protein ComEA
MRFLALAFAAAVAAQAQSFPDGPGKDLFTAICSSCHEPTRVLDKHWTRKQWKDKVLEMLQEEPDVTEKESGQIVEYLSNTFFKKVNVNTAPAKDLEDALEITAKDAAAITAYRSTNAFKTVDDLKKVPGIDGAKLESNRARLEF